MSRPDSCHILFICWWALTAGVRSINESEDVLSLTGALQAADTGRHVTNAVCRPTASSLTRHIGALAALRSCRNIAVRLLRRVKRSGGGVRESAERRAQLPRLMARRRRRPPMVGVPKSGGAKRRGWKLPRRALLHCPATSCSLLRSWSSEPKSSARRSASKDTAS